MSAGPGEEPGNQFAESTRLHSLRLNPSASVRVTAEALRNSKTEQPLRAALYVEAAVDLLAVGDIGHIFNELGDLLHRIGIGNQILQTGEHGIAADRARAPGRSRQKLHGWHWRPLLPPRHRRAPRINRGKR